MYLRQPTIKPNVINSKQQRAKTRVNSVQEIEGSSGSCTKAYIAALGCPQTNPINSTKAVLVINILFNSVFQIGNNCNWQKIAFIYLLYQVCIHVPDVSILVSKYPKTESGDKFACKIRL